MFVFLIFSCVVLLAWAVVATYFAYKFARIIMVFEDDLPEAIDSLKGAEENISEFLSMQMYFDSPEVQREVLGALQGVQAAKLSMAGLIRKFVQRSKQKYVQLVETERNSDND